MNLAIAKQTQIDSGFYHFINDEVLPHTHLTAEQFWQPMQNLIAELMPVNQSLLNQRQRLQQQIDHWHIARKGQALDQQQYQAFLREIGYLEPEVKDFIISTEGVDPEIATMAGPQLVVPVQNARFALNAANARWGSLYDALYGTNALISESEEGVNRAKQVIKASKQWLDEHFPLANGSHADVASYVVYYQHLLAFFDDGSETGLAKPGQFVAFSGHKDCPEAIVLKHHQLHVELCIDRQGDAGKLDHAAIDDIQLEAALTTIVDFEDSVATVDAEDKVMAYKNWLGLIKGDLTAEFEKDGQTLVRQLNPDKSFRGAKGGEYALPGRALLMVRNVGHLMASDLVLQADGQPSPEGIIDAIVTALIASINLDSGSNSRCSSIYIVKPKMHGSQEVAFTCLLFEKVEQLLGLPNGTLKLGIMDEERRTSMNLKACINAAKTRVVFINTGFLDRTGDEIHTSMHAGAFVPKNAIKQKPWFQAYEDSNVAVGLNCGFAGHAQIGKGMWPMPDEMAQMMAQKSGHPKAGANTAWVPSPTAAVLHAMHYHQTDVTQVQTQLLSHLAQSSMSAPLRQQMLQVPLLGTHDTLSEQVISDEISNNVQGILGYVVRWVCLGIGCSKVPDIHHVGLMEDRATLRISSQHLANWLHHGICSEAQVLAAMTQMAAVVDKQNAATPGYQAMTNNLSENLAFNAAKALIFEGGNQPNGYTEPLLHHYRQLAKSQTPEQ
ncbi:malate synthase G [Motilimonas pumila]|uniref:Malate synthase G n=1 Tax=Motilimonas pumila TaxID=2303987 RepID=A0A418YFN3_9GAMM|nr:malate synthase G [Motilimonas pumila]RJG48197.1 malate synthase G [Motilimonas pumila]